MTNHKRTYRTIESLLDILQMHMESNSYDRAEPLLSTLSVYFAHMNDEQRDYFQCAQEAVEEGRLWEV